MPQHNENTGDAIPTSDLNITTTTLEKKEDATAKEKSISTDDTTVDDITMIRQRLKRKLDIRLAVWSMVAFLAVFIDKSNMPNAYISGMKEDLDLESAVYNWADTIMSIGIIIFQIPVGVILPKIYPRWFFPSLAVVLGTIQCCMAFVNNHQGLLALRFFLGVCNSAIQPGIVYLFGTWYSEREIAKRVTTLRSMMGLGAGAGGLIAGAIVQTMTNRAGLRAWQWLFVIEGLIVVAVGLAGFMMVPNYPHQTTSWIAEDEREATLDTQASGNAVIHSSSSPYKWENIKNGIISPYPWLLGCINIFEIFLRQAVKTFVIALNDLGYDSAFANYMSTPMHVFGCIVSGVVGWSADWFGDRVIHLTILGAWATTWNAVLAGVHQGHTPAPLLMVAAYALDPMSVIPSLAMVWSLIIYKGNPNLRALSVGIINCIGLLVPSLVTVKLWVVTDSPVFWLGKITNVGFGCALILTAWIIWFLLRIRFRLPQSASNNMPSKESQINQTNDIA